MLGLYNKTAPSTASAGNYLKTHDVDRYSSACAAPLIYICEDDPGFGGAILLRLQQEGYECRLFGDGAEMDQSSCYLMPDLLLLDVELPGESGHSVAKRYLRAMPSMRVIMMSELNQPQDMLTGYHSGAMLYLLKPFKIEALIACLKGIFGTLSAAQTYDSVITLDMESHKLKHAGGALVLTQNEVKALASMALRSPETIEYHELMEAMGLDLDSARKNTLETLISRLRRKLAVINRPELIIQNKRNVGHQLAANLLAIR
jgi:DNA-binding response OmpR family regulator